MIRGWGHLKFWKHHYDKLYMNHFALDSMAETLDSKVFPQEKYWFRALELTPFKEVRCVILGQDPYPTKGYANGLAFSVYPHVQPLPRSLRNIFTEYTSDLGHPSPRTGDLTGWASEGVLLLNSIFTVEEGKTLSHAGIGWEKLTYEILKGLGERQSPPVFVLWGNRAQEYKAAVGGSPVITASHPSPRSAEKGFFGSRPFSRVNAILSKNGQPEVNWKLS